MSGLGAGHQAALRAGQSRPVPAGFSAKSRSSTVKAQGTGQGVPRHTLLAENKTPEGAAPQAPRTAHAWSSVSRTTVAGGGTVRHGSGGAAFEAPQRAPVAEPAASGAAPTWSAASRTTVAGGATTRHSSQSAAPEPAAFVAPSRPAAPSQNSATDAAPARHSSFVAAAPEAPKAARSPSPGAMAPVAASAPMGPQATARAPSQSAQGFTTAAQSRTVVQGLARARHTLDAAPAAPQRPHGGRASEAPTEATPAHRGRAVRSVEPTPPPVTHYNAHFTYAAPNAVAPEPGIAQRAMQAAVNAAAARGSALFNPEPPPYTEQPVPAPDPGQALPAAEAARCVWDTLRAWSHRATRTVTHAVRATVSYVRNTVARIAALVGRLLG